MFALIFIGLCLQSVLAVHDAQILSMYKHHYTGDGTYYGAVTGGLCSYNVPRLPAVAHHVDRLVALNAPQLLDSSGCGLCFRVNGTGVGKGNDPVKGSFTAYVKDKCPECHPGDLDLAVDGDGRWKIHIQAIQCPVGNTHIEYVLQGSNDWYMKLQVRNERMPATTVDMYQNRSNSWVTLHRTLDGFWTLPSDSRVQKPIVRPFIVRLHAPNGKTLIDHVHAPSMGYTGVIRGDGVQFPLDHSLPSA